MTLPLTAAPAVACTTFMNFPLHTDLPSLEAIAPSRDVYGISCITAGRLVLNLIGALARAGTIGALARAGTFERNATR
jgi:hypothetical protein